MATDSKKPAAKKATLDDEAKLVRDLADILDKACLLYTSPSPRD